MLCLMLFFYLFLWLLNVFVWFCMSCVWLVYDFGMTFECVIMIVYDCVRLLYDLCLIFVWYVYDFGNVFWMCLCVFVRFAYDLLWFVYDLYLIFVFCILWMCFWMCLNDFVWVCMFCICLYEVCMFCVWLLNVFVWFVCMISIWILNGLCMIVAWLVYDVCFDLCMIIKCVWMICICVCFFNWFLYVV